MFKIELTKEDAFAVLEKEISNHIVLDPILSIISPAASSVPAHK